jgi:hypothetical protein
VKFSFLVILLIAAPILPAQAVPQNWFPQAIENLGQTATSKTEFSFDRSMLVMASKADQPDESLRRVIAGVDGISVHRFRFQGPGMYDPQILNAVRQEYRTAGWQHVSSAHDKYGYPSGADLWLRLDHNTIRNIAVLLAGGNQVNFIAVSGSISPLDLLHLAGHFGIPRIDGGVVVPRRGSTGSGPDSGAYPPDSSAPPETRPSPEQEPDYRHPNSEPQRNGPEPN